MDEGGEHAAQLAQQEPEPLCLPSLPLALQSLVLQHVPADQKLLLNRVSPAWKAMADQPALWEHVSLAPASGVRATTDGLLLAVCAKARGGLRTLDTSGTRLADDVPGALSTEVVAAVARVSPGLERLDVRCPLDMDNWQVLTHDQLARLLAAVPQQPQPQPQPQPGLDDLTTPGAQSESQAQAPPPRPLCVVHADVECSPAEAAALRQHAGLRVRRIYVRLLYAASATALLADLAQHPHPPTQLALYRAGLDSAAAVEALCAFALDRRLSALCLIDCVLRPESMPGLARLLLSRACAVTTLEVDNHHDVDLPLATMPAFCAALRGSRLTRLAFVGVRLFDGGVAPGLAVVAAVTGHPTLIHFSMRNNFVAEGPDRTAVGAALGRLVAANARALTSLDASWCNLGDAGLRPLVAALPANGALRALWLQGGYATRAVASSLLAAVRANAGLRSLHAAETTPRHPELAEAEALVAARA